MSKERAHELSIGYDLDGGGYAFEPATDPALEGAYTLDSDTAIRDLGFVEGVSRLSCPVFAFRPTGIYADPGMEWPTVFPGPWEGTRYVLVSSGIAHETDRECFHCEGRGFAKDIEGIEDGTPCDRCEGEGYVLSEGGNWALYGLEDIPTDSDTDPEGVSA